MPPRLVEADPALLDKLLLDLGRAPEPWRVTPYWSNYHDRLVRTIRRDGVKSLQSNYSLLKGFATGGVPQPIPPAHPLKRAVFTALPRVPVVSKVFGSYEKIIKALHRQNIDLRRQVCRDTLDLIAEHFPEIQPPGDVAAGDAEDAFEWRGKQFTTAFIPYLARAADFYRAIAPRTVRSLLEIGPGLGWSTLAHKTLNPELRLVVNIDIPATLYISTQFLKAVGAFDVVDYNRFLQTGGTLVSQPGEPPVCFQLPPWALASVDVPFDFAHNAFSFQEMEPRVVQAYAENMIRLVRQGIWLMSTVEGHKPGAGGQKETVNFGVIETSFGSAFERAPAELTAFCRRFGIHPDMSRLYLRVASASGGARTEMT